MTDIIGHPLHPIASALGRAHKQAVEDRNEYARRRIETAQAALEKAESVCPVDVEIDEKKERFARELLLDIVDSSIHPVSALALTPFVLFVRSCRQA